MSQARDKNPPAITGEEPVEEALKKVMAHLGTPDRQAAVRHLARVCWAGPLEPWLREPDGSAGTDRSGSAETDRSVVDLEVGNNGTVTVRRADGTLNVTEQKLSPKWIEFLVKL